MITKCVRTSSAGGLPNLLGLAAFLASLVVMVPAQAAPIAINNSTINMFRDTRGANNAGIGPGDVLQ